MSDMNNVPEYGTCDQSSNETYFNPYTAYSLMLLTLRLVVPATEVFNAVTRARFHLASVTS